MSMTRAVETDGGRAAVSPDSAEVASHLSRVVGEHGSAARLLDLGLSAEGRPLQAVAITDRGVPDAEKQHVLVVAGQHGNEESSRMVALALIDHLVSPAGQAVRQRQKVVVYPNANPDGCEADSYANAEGLLINMDHAPGGPKTREGRAVAALLDELRPDLYIDCHACGHTGFGTDMVLYPITRRYTEDDNHLHAMARRMAKAGEAAGLPQITHSLAWWGGDDVKAETSSTLAAYLRYKSMVMLIENCEDNTGSYPAALRARTGLAKVLAAMQFGQERHAGCADAGYPSQLILGMNSLAVVAVGESAAARRNSRVAVWREADHFEHLRFVLPQAEKHKRVRLDYTGQPAGPVGIQTRAAGRFEVARVALDARPLDPSRVDGWFSFHDDCSTYVVVALPELTRGTYTIDITLR